MVYKISYAIFFRHIAIGMQTDAHFDSPVSPALRDHCGILPRGNTKLVEENLAAAGVRD